jgi:Domain of unknown function (DUF1876)
MNIHFARHGRITEATVWADPDGIAHTVGIVGQGTATRSKNDIRLDEIGETIALGRAIQDFGRQVEMRGHAACVTKEEYDRVNALIDKRDQAIITEGITKSLRRSLKG